MESTRSFLDLLKVKASYGIQGNDNLGVDFAYTDLYRVTNQNDNFGLNFARKGNPNITWEKSSNFNIGAEFAFFKHRLTGGVEFFRRSVSDMLFKLSVPVSSGYAYYWDNIGAMSNTGVDFELRGVPFRNKDIEWSVYINGGHVTNRIDKLPAEWKTKEYGHVSGIAVFREGGSLGDLFIPQYLGVTENGAAKWKTKDGETTDYTTAQLPKNRTYYTNLAPKVRGGIGTNVDFYGFDFGAAFSYSIGGKTIDEAYQSLMRPKNGDAMHKDLLKAWTPNRKSDIPRLETNKEFHRTSDRFLVSRTYFSIDNLTLGYTFPKAWLDKINLGSLRVYAVADNIWLFSARKGFDPRFGGGVGYKAIRTISGGLNLTF